MLPASIARSYTSSAPAAASMVWLMSASVCAAEITSDCPRIPRRSSSWMKERAERLRWLAVVVLGHKNQAGGPTREDHVLLHAALLGNLRQSGSKLGALQLHFGDHVTFGVRL